MEQNQKEISFSDLNFEEIDLGESTEAQTAEQEVEVNLEQEAEETETTEEVTEEAQEQETPEEGSEEEPEKKEEKKEVLQPSSYHTDLVKDLLEEGEWEDVEVETEEGEFIKLSEMVEQGKVDKTTYLSIKKDNEERQKEDLKNNYLSIKDLDETKKALIEIIKDGDYDKAKELFENPQQLRRPFEEYDSSNDSHNEQVYAWYLQGLNHDAEEIRLLVNKAKKDLSIDQKAEKIVTHQQKMFDDKLKEEKEKTKQASLKQQEDVKEFKKKLTEKYKAEQLPDKLIKSIVSNSTKTDKDGDWQVHSLYDEAMQDPEKAADIIFYLTNPEKFLAHKMSETKRSTQIDGLRQIRRVQEQKANKQTTAQKEEDTQPQNAFETITLD